jgi:hypothetical protein
MTPPFLVAEFGESFDFLRLARTLEFRHLIRECRFHLDRGGDPISPIFSIVPASAASASIQAAMILPARIFASEQRFVASTIATSIL